MLGVVGLGNPGSRYFASRHNIGFRVVSAFRRHHRLPGFERHGRSELSQGCLDGRDVLLALPQTYMNRSGEAVLELVESTGLAPVDMLVVVDDVSLPLGRIRVRRGGGAGGHNGLSSIIEMLGDTGFPRLRVGVGGPGAGEDLAEYVLDDFAADEAEQVPGLVSTALDTVSTFLACGIDAAMNRFNAAGELPAAEGEV